MDSLHDDFLHLISNNEILNDLDLDLFSVLYPSSPQDEAPTHDTKRNVEKVDPLPDVIIFTIHGLNGEHAYLVNISLPSTPQEFSYSPIQLFEDGVDESRFAEEATRLLNEVAAAILGKQEEYILIFLASDIGGSVLKKALHQASETEKFSDILNKTALLVFFGTPHRASSIHSWQTILSGLLLKYYPNRLESWPQGKIEDLTVLHKSIASDFQKLNCKCRIVSYFQDDPIDAEYKLISPRFPTTLDWPQEIRIAAHRHHNLIGDFYILQDRQFFQQLIHNTRVERQTKYKSWHLLLAKTSQSIVPLQTSDPIFTRFSDWLFISNPLLRAWALDSQIIQPGGEMSDKEDPVTDTGNSAKKISEKNDDRLESADSVDDIVTCVQDFPKRPRSSILTTLHTVSLESGTRSCNLAILHSSLITAIQSQRSSLDFQNDIFINLPGISSSQEQLSVAHLISSLCKQLLSHQPTLVSNIQHLYHDIDRIKVGFDLDFMEKLLWKCLLILLQRQNTAKIFILIYEPTDPILAIPYSRLYQKILRSAETVELRSKFLYIRHRNPLNSETHMAGFIVESNILLFNDEAVASFEADRLAQLNGAEISEYSRAVLKSNPRMHANISSCPLDAPIFFTLMSRKGLASTLCSDHRSYSPPKELISLILETILLPQRSFIISGLMLLIYGARPLETLEFGAFMLTFANTSMEVLKHAESITKEFVYLLCGLVEIRENLVCVAHVGLLEYIMNTKDSDTKWYHISKSEANKKLADICMKTVTNFHKHETGDTISSIEYVETNRGDFEDHPLLLYAVDNWWIHAKVSTNFSALELPAELRSHLELWFNTWRSIKEPNGQKPRQAESKCIEPISLSNHVQLPIDDCMQVALTAARIPASADQDPWSLITLAALQWGRDKISTKLISQLDGADSLTLLGMFQTCQESFLCSLPPALKVFAEENLLELLLNCIHRGHEKLLSTLVETFEASPILNANETRISLLNAYAATGYLHPSLAKTPWLLTSLEIKQQMNTSNCTPLHSAAISGHAALVKTMVQWGINLDKTNDQGETALLLACRYGNYSVVKLLLEAGASHTISAGSKSPPALYEACSGGFVDIVRIFIEHSAPLFGIGVDEKTTLHVALDHGHSQVATLLLSSLFISSTAIDDSLSCKIFPELDQQDSNGRTPLIAAVEWNNILLVKALIQRGVNPEIQDKSGRSAIHYASKYGYFDIFLDLLNNTNTRDREKRLHIFKFLQDVTIRGHIRVLKELLDKIPLSSEIESDLEIALQRAIEWGQTEAARLLLLHCNHRIPDYVLFPAARSGYVEMVILLLDHGANVNARDDQTDCSSLLHIAASNRHTLLVRDLLLRGAYVNIFNTDEQSPLLAAVASGSIEIVEMLLRAGADINVTDSFGHTPLNSAASTGHTLILSLLLTANASRDSALQHNNKLRSLLELAFVNTTYDVFSVIVQQIKKRATGPRLVPSDATLQEFITTSKYDPKRLWVLGILFSNGLDINAHIGQYGGLLHYAAGWGRLELVEFLIQPRGLVEVDMDMFNKGLGETPLQLAASMCGGDEPAAIISKLLSKGANSRLGGPKYGSILHAAVNMPVYQGHETNFSKSSSVVKRLLEHDEQAMHVIGGDQGTVLQSAVMGGNTDMVKLLLERGARREYSDSPSGRHGTAVHAAFYNPDHPVIDLLKSLRLYRTDFEVKDQEGRLPLHIAASRLQGRLFKTICGVYNNVKYRDSQGRTALHFAAGRGRAANVKAILAQDPSLIHEADEDGWTPLHWACRSSDLPTIQLLLDEGARVEDVTKRGWLPRDVAVWHGGVGISKVETPEDFAPSVEPSVVAGEGDVETNARVYKAARLATWTSLRTNETWTPVRCDSCECDIYDMRYTCKTCWDMDYCFKCFRNIKLIQHHGSHIFSKLNPESEEVDTINPWVHEKELEGLMDGV